MRKAIIEKAKNPYERETNQKRKKLKLKLLERTKEEDTLKPVQLYAKTGEIRLRDLSPSKLRNKNLRMKNYGRWYVQPDNFNDLLKLSPNLSKF